MRHQTEKEIQNVRRADVVRMTGLSYSTLYRYELAGGFPARRRIGQNSVAWLRSEVEAWIEQRPVVAGRVS